MPRCEGRATGPGSVLPCPDNKNDASVRSRQGDLFLCDSCTEFRFPSGSSSATANKPVSAKTDQVEQSIRLNELLCFVTNKYDSHPRSVLYDTIVKFYREDEIMAAKQLLVQCGEFANCQSIQSHMKKRIGENKAERSADDILSLFTYLDENDARNRLPLFCAATLSRVPVIADEMSDMEIVKKELATVKQQVSVIVDKMSTPTTTTYSSAVANLPSVAVPQTAHIVPDEVQSATVNEEVENQQQPSSRPAMYAWQTVQSKRERQNDKRQHKVVTGNVKHQRKMVTGNSVDDISFKGVAKKSVVCVGRLELGTPTDAVTKFLEGNGIKVISCFEVSTKAEAIFTNMRLCVPQCEVEKLYNSELWPTGVVVRPWRFKNKE